jgi:hypothetical protein
LNSNRQIEEKLKQRLKVAVSKAGVRYRPGIEAASPNIPVDRISEVLKAAGLHSNYKMDLSEHILAISSSLKFAEESGLVITGTVNHPSQLVNSLREVLDSINAEEIRARLHRVVKMSQKLQKRYQEKLDGHRSGEVPFITQERVLSADTNSDQVRVLGDLKAAISSLLYYLTSYSGQLLTTRSCVWITGAAGAGKTHLLCDFAQEALNNKYPVLLVLGEEFVESIDPLDALAAISGIGKNGAELLTSLDELGRTLRCRSVVVIDAVNDGPRDIWIDQLRSLQSKLANFPNVALVLSCRNSFEKLLNPRGIPDSYVCVNHFGFDYDESNLAQEAYFKHYNIASPEVPLLHDEFSNPLLLAVVCEAIQNLSARDQKSKLRDLHSGIESLNHLYEQLAKEKGRYLENQYSLKSGAIWDILKGSGINTEEGFAGVMASSFRDWISYEEAINAIRKNEDIDPVAATNLLVDLVGVGLIHENAGYGAMSSDLMYRFTYQRISDGLIARRILKAHLPEDLSEQSLKFAFSVDGGIGKYFECDDGNGAFIYPGIVEAIILEFPNRVKRADVTSECFYFLPDEVQERAPLADPFIRGLFWRSSDAVTEKTVELVSNLWEHNSATQGDLVLPVLFQLGTRRHSTFSGEWLWKKLAEMEMANRDIWWSEFIRNSGDDGEVGRYLKWMKSCPQIQGPKLAINHLQILALLLTTTDRTLRDEVTKVLVDLGAKWPSELFNIARDALHFNDPYVPERVLAASYGVSLRQWTIEGNTTTRREIVQLAHDLADSMLSPESPHATTHSLMRDYARGIIEIARNIDPDCNGLTYFRDRSNQDWVENTSAEVQELDLTQVSAAIGFDFNHYVIGSLARKEVDGFTPVSVEAGRLRMQIEGRIAHLGYTNEKFATIDKSIGFWNTERTQYRNVDRYGKKYSWIAYFEMYGLKELRGQLDLHDDDHRSSYCDLDVSFPKKPKEWEVVLPDVFKSAPKSVSGWVKDGPEISVKHLFFLESDSAADGGPWILIDGSFVWSDKRGKTAHLDVETLLVNKSEADQVVALLNRVGGSRGLRIPGSSSDYYTFAGEYPWSSHCLSGSKQNENFIESPKCELTEILRHGESKKIMVERTAYRWVWESYHSALNKVEAVTLLHPWIASHLDLITQDGEFELRDSGGHLATRVRIGEVEGEYRRNEVLYFREDQLAKYLTSNQLALIWVERGTRNTSQDPWKTRQNPKIQAAYDSRANDFLQVTVYRPPTV